LLLPVAAAVPVVNIATATKIKVEPEVVLVLPEMVWCAMDTTAVTAVQEPLRRPVETTVVEDKQANSAWAVTLGAAAADIPQAAAAAAIMVVAVATTMAAAAVVLAMLTLA
jgi:hypothetical protein